MARNIVITREDLLDLRSRPADGGVLSVYLRKGDRAKAPHHTGSTALNAGLRELQRAYPDDRQLAALADEVRRLYRKMPREDRQRHLAIILSAVPEWSWWRSLQWPVDDRFVWMDTPYLRPLMGLLDHAPRVGVIAVARSVVRVLTWNQGLIEEEVVRRFELADRHWRRYAGPAPAHPGTRQQTATYVERYVDRVAVHEGRFLQEVTDEIAGHGERAGWERVVVLGPSDLTGTLVAALPEPWRQRVVPAPPINVARAGPAPLADAATAAVETWAENRDLQEIEELLGLVASGGRASASPQECLDLLEQGRVSHLYLDTELRLQGYRRPDGTLVIASPAEPAHDWVPERHLVERAISLALDQGIRVTPVRGEAAERLREVGGIGARLRY
ncbi:MAG: VLRF1 family aeRF1-type release factor [Armatimonadota bacterium]|nr:VLRF1 family aeRF1-type release factor [Armatimonadota bacterium]